METLALLNQLYKQNSITAEQRDEFSLLLRKAITGSEQFYRVVYLKLSAIRKAEKSEQAIRLLDKATQILSSVTTQ